MQVKVNGSQGTMIDLEVPDDLVEYYLSEIVDHIGLEESFGPDDIFSGADSEWFASVNDVVDFASLVAAFLPEGVGIITHGYDDYELVETDPSDITEFDLPN